MRGSWIAVGFALVLLQATACGDDGQASGGSGGSGASSSDGGAGSGAAPAGGSDPGGGGGEGGAGGAPVETALVHAVGRFDTVTEPGAMRFSWSGTTLATRIDGAGLDVSLDAPDGVWFQVVVDGEPATTFVTAAGTTTYPMVAGLDPGQHDVALIRRNEGFFGAVSFLEFTPHEGTSLVESASPYQHTIEFIGDSITCGYGIEGPDAFCDFTGGTETVYTTYAAIASRNVGAAAHFIAYSGKGVHQNYGGNTDEPMPELYGRTITNDSASVWGFDQFTPEVVVLNLGTNDFSAAIDGDAFVTDYVALLGTIRGHYPQAHIVTVTWAHWGQGNEDLVHEAVAQFADPLVLETRFAILPEDGFGCDYHPSIATNQKLGAQLTTLLQTELGW